jgi:NTP pyrophosphatase (non-canonical NTP hydrolase)
MADTTTTLATLREAMRQFVSERDWDQFHSPKNLAMGLAVEAGELMEHFLWIDNPASRELVLDPQQQAAIGEEMADVACYLLALANVMKLDLSTTILDKLKKNAHKYPAEQYRGKFRKEESS